MKLLNGLTLLLAFQLIGEAISLYFSLRIPGPVLGMLLLFLSLVIFYRKQDASKEPADDALTTSASVMLSHLSLLFIPAGVGLIVHIDRLESQWLPILASIVLGSIITMVVTVWVMLLVNRVMKIEKVNSGNDESK